MLSSKSWTTSRPNQAILKEIIPWIFNGRTDAEAEAPIFWPPNVKSQLIGKDPDAGKVWRQKEKTVAEDVIDSITNSMDMIWETQGVSEGQGSL